MMTLLALLLAPAAQIPLRISAPHTVHAGRPVEIDLSSALPSAVRIARVTDGEREVPWQLDGSLLTFLLASPMAAGESRTGIVHLGAASPKPADRVHVTDVDDHAGQRSLRIETSAATYLYHVDGAGFASLFDRDGNDWISYRPGGRSAGEYRGIPNLGVYAHPGYAGESGGSTTIEARGPLKVRLRSISRDGSYVTVWDFFPEYARLTIEKAAQPYWFLYEGTPGGKLDLDSDFVVTSAGVERPASQSWHGDLPAPEWVYFGDRIAMRVLFLVNHQEDDASDQFWPMEGNMTVFGFGREYRCCGRYLTAAPAQFTIGLLDGSNFDSIKRAVESAWRPVRVEIAAQGKR